MKVLLDENIPLSLWRHLPGHECEHVIRLGWRGVKNGVLLDRAEREEFDAIISLDADMPGEQRLDGRRILLVVLTPREQGKNPVHELAPEIDSALKSGEPGSVVYLPERS